MAAGYDEAVALELEFDRVAPKLDGGHDGYPEDLQYGYRTAAGWMKVARLGAKKAWVFRCAQHDEKGGW